MPRRAVFLDRDGVLNRAIVRGGKPYPPAGVHEMEILPGVADACRQLKAAGFLLVVVSNQPDVARGTQRREVIEAIDDVMQSHLSLDDFRVCYHDNADHCACRKPKPGLLVQAASDWNIDLRGSFLVGDRYSDVQAGHAAGCTTVFLDYGYTEPMLVHPDHIAHTLQEAASWIVRDHVESPGEPSP